MDEAFAALGVRVKTRVEFAGVPAGSEGVIVEDYGSGITVAWDLPTQPLPAWAYPDELSFKNMPACHPSAPLRDGFDKATELHFLDLA